MHTKQHPLKEFDTSEHLKTPEDIVDYLNAIIAKDDQELFLAALGDVAKAIGMTQIAQKTGLGRESLYKTFSGKANPRFETINAVLKAMGASIQLSTRANH